MKQNTHPTYFAMTVSCACGNKFEVGGTRKDMHVDVCDKCHPFFTGTQKFLDTMGRVDKFMAKRAASVGYVRKNKKNLGETDNTPKSLKEMLDSQKVKAAATAPVAEA